MIVVELLNVNACLNLTITNAIKLSTKETFMMNEIFEWQMLVIRLSGKKERT